MSTSTPQQALTRALLESPDLARIESHLLLLLQQTGWAERLRETCTRLLREGEAMSYEQLMEKVREQAVGEVPESVKVEVVGMVGGVVRGRVE